MKNFTIVLFVLLSVIISGCARDTLQKYEPYNIPDFAPIEDYELDVSRLDDIQSNTINNILDNQIFIKFDEETGSIEVVSEDEANAVLMMSEDFANVADLADVSEAYREVAVSQEELINIKNQTIRALQQMVMLQQQSKLIYIDQFIAADSLYRQEHKLRVRERILSDARFIATVIGVIAVSTL